MAEQGQPPARLLTDGELGFLRQFDADLCSPAFAGFQEWFGFIPNHILAQTMLPRLIDAEFQVSSALLFQERALTRRQKELILLAGAAAHENAYAAGLHYQMLRSLDLETGQLNRILVDYRQAGLSENDVAILDFTLRLGRHPTWVTRADIEGLRAHGFADEHILDSIVTTSWSSYLCTLSTGLGVRPHIAPPDVPPATVRRTAFQPPSPRRLGESSGPYVRVVDLPPASFPPFATLRAKWGFVPNLFRAQTLWPDLVEAECRAIKLWLLTGDILSKRQKECIFLAVSAANLNSYCVAAHCEILRGLGVSEEESERIALDHRHADLSGADKILLDVCLKLVRRPDEFGETDVQALREQQFSDKQILEGIAIVAVANFVNTLNTGLGVEPDFEPRIQLVGGNGHRSPADDDLIEARVERSPLENQDLDPDSACVAGVQAGDAAAFEELIRRHGRRIRRTLAVILKQEDDVDDALQDTFVKAFQYIGQFQRRAKFATWLTRIAVNTGLQRLRGRREVDSLDANPDSLDTFRPRMVRAWQDDPEQCYSKAEMRELIWQALAQLPLKYRIVVTLRDLQQFSTSETASALGLEVSTVKSRLLRGRLMLREALSPHFIRKDAQRAHG